MKTIAICTLLALAACGRKPGAPEGTVYGEGVTSNLSIQISDLYERVDDLAGQRVRVEGMITGVCAKRGCWMELASDKEFQTLRFKVPDGVIVFPMSAKGKYAVAEGIVRKFTRQAKRPGGFLRPRTEEITVVQLDGKGAVVRDEK